MLNDGPPLGLYPTEGRLRLVLGEIGATNPAQPAEQMLSTLISAGLDQLPLPASGVTLARWRALSEVAFHDLSLGKLFESHTDALAILAELDASYAVPHGSSWGVWAAEPPDARVTVSSGTDRRVTLQGKKSWCSGAAYLSHALVTVWCADGTGPFLARVHLKQDGVRVSAEGWNAVGMVATGSVDVYFSAAEAVLVAGEGAYLRRPGFWHGGAGIAACWYGGAMRLAQTLHRVVRPPNQKGAPDFRCSALGKVDVALQQTAALLRAGAAWIDANPVEDAMVEALRVRMAAEECATLVLYQAGRSLGAGAFCKDAAFARMAADLPVFIRQSGGERDANTLGSCVAALENTGWAL